jgi:ketosteroid isomerase-like protein
MPTTGDVLDQHLRRFGEDDLDGVVADYSSDAVLFEPAEPLKGPDAIKPSWAWVDIEDVLSDEWEIGGLAMKTDAIRALVADE